jgi:predicted TIM-barrel fold metal-dependent hydrolase
VVELDQIMSRKDFTLNDGKNEATRAATFLPEPERRKRYYTLISVDDHIVEPPNMFQGRMPDKFVDRAPRVVESDGAETWLYDGDLLPNVGFNAVVGRPLSEYSFEPARFDQMRAGAWDVDKRVHDMNLNGVYASVNFPSFLAGFAGQRLQLNRDPDLALAAVRAWNSFYLEEWTGRYPERFIPVQLPWLTDPHFAAEEIYRNAELGFKGVSFSEGPDKLGLPSVHTDYWDPFLRACEETETVICLHFGSSGTSPMPSPDAPPETMSALFGMNVSAAVDWLYSRIPVRFPQIKLCLSEGGVGWVPPLLDRLDHMLKYQGAFATWQGVELTPSEVFTRNFWVCAIDEPSAMLTRERTGVENILLESDYPHADSTWPDTQETVRKSLKDLSAEDVERISWRNASELFRHPVPVEVQRDPDAF